MPSENVDTESKPGLEPITKKETAPLREGTMTAILIRNSVVDAVRVGLVADVRSLITRALEAGYAGDDGKRMTMSDVVDGELAKVASRRLLAELDVIEEAAKKLNAIRDTFGEECPCDRCQERRAKGATARRT